MMLLCLVSAMQLLIIYVPLRKKNVLAKEFDRQSPHKSEIPKGYALQVSEIMTSSGSVYTSVLVAEGASISRT